MSGDSELDGETRGVSKRHDRLEDLHEIASMLLEGLDELGLHEAAAYCVARAETHQGPAPHPSDIYERRLAAARASEVSQITRRLWIGK
jgi:hypothetical protein